MAICFFDASALVKRFHKEHGSDLIHEIIENPDNTLVIASITLSEMTSAFRKKTNTGVINEDELQKILSEFSLELVNKFVILDIERNHIHVSQDVIVKYNLRALDGIQLAVLLSLKNVNPLFVCSDKRLLTAAKEEGIKVLNPEA